MSDEVKDVIRHLRESVPSILPKVYLILISLALEVMNPLLDAKMGPREKRVFVGGYFLKEGRENVNKVARKVSSLGYSVLTDFGFYRAGEPEVLHSISQVTPPAVVKLKEAIPSHILYHELPQVADKAVLEMTIEKGQNDELRGCYNYRIPLLGFVIHDKIKKRMNCMFLKSWPRHVECRAFDRELCTRNRASDKFCPFYDSVKMSWASLQLFLTGDNTIVAVKSLDDLDMALEQFLKYGAKRQPSPS